MAFAQGRGLLIGVGTHQFHPQIDVPITVADTQALAEVLVDPNACGYPADQVHLLHDEAASKAGMLGALEALAERTGEQDTVFFFYCGHGALGADGDYYLVSHDARLQGGRVVPGTGVSEGELLARLRQVKAQRMLLVFNACFAGHIAPTLAAGAPALAASSLAEETSAALLATGSGRILITACRAQGAPRQKSYIGDGEHTLFTQALVDGLRGKGVGNRGGYISAFSLYEHIFETVSETVSRLYNEQQEPELTVLKGVGPFAVALYKGASTLGQFDAHQPLPTGPAVHQVQPEKSQKFFIQIVRQSGGVNLGQGNQTNISGGVVGGDKIDARGSQGFINKPTGPVTQHYGSQTNTGGGAYIAGDVNTGGGEFVGRDQHVHGEKERD